jgi:hypothetical protein
MSEVAVDTRKTRTTIWLWLLIACGVAGVAAANAHLVYVATTSQPDCVTHVRQGEGNGQLGRFSAAQSNCSAPMPAPAVHSSERDTP